MQRPFDMTIDPRAAAVLSVLESNGHSAWFVGGCVRDAAIGRPAHDFDIATSAPWQETARLFEARGCHVITAGARHGSVGIVWQGMVVEATTYRTESGYSDGRRPDAVAFVDDIRLDLARRDFRMNAMAYHPQRGLLDPFGGLEDIEAHRIATVGDAQTRFSEDPLRIMRALRFSSELGFPIDDATDAALRLTAGDLQRIARERVFAELSKLLMGPSAGVVVERYAAVLDEVVPGIAALDGYPCDPRRFAFDLLGHTAHTVDAAPARLELRLAALLHDIAKPACIAKGRAADHPGEGARMAHRILQRLKAPRRTIEQTCALIAAHGDHFIPCRRAAWLLVAAHDGDAAFVRDSLSLQRADAIGHGMGETARVRSCDAMLDHLEALVAEGVPLSTRELAIGGRDVIAAGIEAGPAVKQALDLALLCIIEGRTRNDAAALTAALDEISRSVRQHQTSSENIFQKILHSELTESSKHDNILTRA